MNKKAVGMALAVFVVIGLVFMSFLDSNVAPAAAAEEKAAAKAAPAPAAAPPPVAAPAPVKEVAYDPKKLPKVIATIGGVEVNREIFVRVLDNLIRQMKSHGQPITEEWLKNAQKQVADRMVVAEVLYQDAQAKKIKVDDKEVQDQIDKIAKSFPSPEEYKKGLKEQGITEKDLKRDIGKNLAIRRLLDEKAAAGVKVDEAEAKKYYDEHTKEFDRPEMVRARHIILLVDKAADDAKKAEAKKKMDEIQAELKGGAKFEDVAKKHSQDGSAESGGDLGFFPKGAMVKEFEDAVWNMKPGEVSGVVATPFGLHIIKFEERKAAGSVPFAEMKNDLIRGLESQKKGDAVKSYIENLKAKAKIKINI
ncbi:MAG: peptidylprolyl isomerase [Nitrospinae bacterium]|nr:peptidylprolyl isomerase [Nitrospinota bacterium]